MWQNLTCINKAWMCPEWRQPSNFSVVYDKRTFLVCSLGGVEGNINSFIMEKLLNQYWTQPIAAIKTDIARHSLEMCLIDSFHVCPGQIRNKQKCRLERLGRWERECMYTSEKNNNVQTGRLRGETFLSNNWIKFMQNILNFQQAERWTKLFKLLCVLCHSFISKWVQSSGVCCQQIVQTLCEDPYCIIHKAGKWTFVHVLVKTTKEKKINDSMLYKLIYPE